MLDALRFVLGLGLLLVVAALVTVGAIWIWGDPTDNGIWDMGRDDDAA